MTARPGPPDVASPTVLLVLGGVTLAATLRIAAGGTPLGHDMYWHALWLGQFAGSLSDGVLYPRWLPDVNGGLGNPTFVFYPPLLYYVAAACLPLAGSVPRALDLAAAGLLALSGLAGYAYLRGALARGPALVGAAALVALPYRLIDLYDRSALPELAAFAWPPLVLLGLRHLDRADTTRAAGVAAAGTAAATAALAFTHLPSLVLWGPPLALVALAGVARGRPRHAIRAAAALALGLGLAAVSLLPVAAERSLVQLENLALPGPPAAHTLFAAHGDAFNDKVSRVGLFAAGLVAIAGTAALWPGGGGWRRADRPERGLPVWGAVLLSACALVLMMPAGLPIWSRLPAVGQLQFPWRLLLLVTPAAAMLVACAAARLTAPGATGAARALAVAALAVLAGNLFLSAREIVMGETVLDTAEAARYAALPATKADAAEYRPRTAPRDDFPSLPRATSLVPGGRVEVLAWRAEHRVLAVRAAADGWVQVATFYYPGWHATAAGRPLAVRAGAHGLIEIEVPAGRPRVVDLRFGATPLRRAGALLSASSLAGLLLWASAGLGERLGRRP